MASFFALQLDYVFFVYGLSFLVLAAVCLINSAHIGKSLPFPLLGLFALTHGLNEWLDMVALTVVGDPALAWTRLFLLVGSFLVLAEFARRSWRRRLPHLTEAWVLLPALILMGWGALAAGMPGAQAGARYGLALLGGLAAAAAILHASRSGRGHGSLAVAGWAMAAYALAAGLIPPPSPFLAAPYLNTETVLHWAGFPIQLVRTLCAITLAVAVWVYEQGRFSATVLRGRRRGYLVHGLTSLAVVVAMGWLVTETLSRRDREAAMDQAQSIADMVEERLAGNRAVLRGLAEAMAGSRTLTSFDKTNEAAAIHSLRRFASILPGMEAMIFDLDGRPRLSAWPDRDADAPVALPPDPRDGRIGLRGGVPEIQGSATMRDGHGTAVGLAVVSKRLTAADLGFEHLAEAQLLDGTGRAILGGEGGTPGRSEQDISLPVAGSDWRVSVRADLSDLNRHRLLSILVTALAACWVIASFAVLQRELTLSLRLEEAWRAGGLVLRSAGEGICGLDRDGRVTFINPAARQLLGWDENEGVGEPLHQRIHHSHPDGTPYAIEDCPVHKALADPELALSYHSGNRVQDHYWRKDGSSFPVEYTLTPSIQDDHLDGMVIVFHDITDRLESDAGRRRAEEELRRSNADLEQFAYVASHDLKQPLRMISSFLTLLDKRLVGRLEGDERDFIRFAVDGAKRLDTLITGLLEFSRVGRLGEPQPVALGTAISEALGNLAVEIKETGTEIELPPAFPTVRGHPMEVMRLMLNLVGNAIKYCVPDRIPKISLSYREDGGHWIISVKDNGIGIAPEDQERVFGIFQRLVTRDQYEGTGIGLAVCKRIAERAGGRIWIESEPGVGSTFFVSLPKG
jgi:PAS domain S-box-containing protein